MHGVQVPVIPAVAEQIRAHPGTISLGQGVTYYGPPAAAIERIRDFLADPENHKYGPPEGVPRLIELIGEKLRTENGIAYGMGHRVLVTAGANMGFLNAMLAIADPGDEVILPLPYYFNQEMAVRMVSAVPIGVPTDERYRPSLDRLQAAISPRTRAIVTVSPNNPTGAVYTEADLGAINRLCQDRGLYHISDEAYETFTYEGARHFSPASLAGSAGHTISLFSLSKAYGFASWRIGYMLIPEHLYSAVLKVQDTNLICAPMISQYAAIGALETGSSYCREKLVGITRARERVLGELQSLGALCSVPAAEGALYLFLRVHTEVAPMVLVEELIRRFGVAVIPGTTFGMDRGCYLRVSFGALDADTAATGARRLVRGLRAIVRERRGIGAQ